MCRLIASLIWAHLADVPDVNRSVTPSSSYVQESHNIILSERFKRADEQYKVSAICTMELQNLYERWARVRHIENWGHESVFRVRLLSILSPAFWGRLLDMRILSHIEYKPYFYQLKSTLKWMLCNRLGAQKLHDHVPTPKYLFKTSIPERQNLDFIRTSMWKHLKFDHRLNDKVLLTLMLEWEKYQIKVEWSAARWVPKSLNEFYIFFSIALYDIQACSY